MSKLYITLSPHKQSISICYKIENQEIDNSRFLFIVNLVKENKLACQFGEDDFKTRCFTISGQANIISKVYDELEEKLK